MNPINISSDEITAQCNEKCKYSIKYPSIATFNLHNREKNILINRISDGIVASLSNVEYTLNSIQIFYQSRLLYNENKSDAEIVLKHTATSIGNNSLQNLEVYIPITVNSDVTETSNIIENIINSIKKSAPNKDESTTYTPEKEFEVNQFIPKNPYYTKQISSKQTTILAFGISDSIKISSSALEELKLIINPTELFKTDNIKLYKSIYPPSIGTAATNSNIYIDCQPINESTETVEMVYNKPTNSITKFDIDNPLILTIIVLIVVIVLIAGVNMLL